MTDQDLTSADVTAIAELLGNGVDNLGADNSALAQALHRAVEGNLDDAIASWSSRI